MFGVICGGFGALLRLLDTTRPAQRERDGSSWTGSGLLSQHRWERRIDELETEN